MRKSVCSSSSLPRSWPAPRRTRTIPMARPTTSASRSRSKASWCSSSSATRIPSSRSRRRTTRAPAAVGGRVERHGQLANQGVTRETLKLGDEVVVIGRPSRVPGEFRALMVSLKRPSDGFTLGRAARRSGRLERRAGLEAQIAARKCMDARRSRPWCRCWRRPRLGAQQPGRGGPPPAAREAAAHRSHRLLGVGHHRRLEVPDGHAEEGRVRDAAAERRGPEGGDTLGPGARRSRRRAVPGVRRRQHHARAGPSAHHVARRQHAADRHRCRHADAAVSLRRRRRRPAEPSWQGHSVARWEYGPGGGRGQARVGNLKVVTTNLRPGYVRKNGAPYSDAARP